MIQRRDRARDSCSKRRSRSASRSNDPGKTSDRHVVVEVAHRIHNHTDSSVVPRCRISTALLLPHRENCAFLSVS
jgi:hypothetical protein